MKLTKADSSYILKWAKRLKAIWLLGGKCHLCGDTDYRVLTFHHLNPKEKEFDINEIKNHRWSILEQEVKKCILLCQNCHRETHDKVKQNVRNNAKEQTLLYKRISNCEQCGYDKCINALSFHHRYPSEKEFTISDIFEDLRSSKSVAAWVTAIQSELDKCDVLCSNCHAIAHIDVNRIEKFKQLIAEKAITYRELQRKVDRYTVYKLKDSGMSNSGIAKQLNCTPSTVTLALQQRNL